MQPAVRPGSHIGGRKPRTHDRRSIGNFPTAKNIVGCDGIEIFPRDCTSLLIQVRVAFSLIITEGRDMGACQLLGPYVRMYATTKFAELS